MSTKRPNSKTRDVFKLPIVGMPTMVWIQNSICENEKEHLVGISGDIKLIGGNLTINMIFVVRVKSQKSFRGVTWNTIPESRRENYKIKAVVRPHPTSSPVLKLVTLDGRETFYLSKFEETQGLTPKHD